MTVEIESNNQETVIQMIMGKKLEKSHVFQSNMHHNSVDVG